MSIATQVNRLKSAGTIIKAKSADIEISTSTDKLDQVATKFNNTTFVTCYQQSSAPESSLGKNGDVCLVY